MPTYQNFIFERYSFDADTKRLFLGYSFDGQINFTETIQFNFDIIDFDKSAFNRACFGLWLMAGISYFKADLPPNIILKQGTLDKKSADFFTEIYLQGLGEFWYQNDLDPAEKINFPVITSAPKDPIHLDLARNLLPIGGGKDSLVSAEILDQAGIEYTPWVVGESDVQTECCQALGKNPLKITRTLDPKLLELNQTGALNGHVPISAILAFLSVCTAILTGKKNIVLSNEASANSENLEWKGLSINHQYSKSLDFERHFQTYVHENISPDIQYFSLLRPWSELKIAKFFGRHAWKKYRKIFGSCNRNFHLQKNSPKKRWCNQCPKCAFVFLILSPFVPREELIVVFGENLFIKPELKTTFAELLGLEGQKPFECVGEIAECQAAAYQALERFPELKPLAEKLKNPPTFDLNKLAKSAMPDTFMTLIKNHT